MTEEQRALWTMSIYASVCSVQFCDGGVKTNWLQLLCDHKDLTDARRKRDKRDGDLLAAKQTEFSPYATDSSLRNLISRYIRTVLRH